jgi:hypothetical protein
MLCILAYARTCYLWLMLFLAQGLYSAEVWQLTVKLVVKCGFQIYLSKHVLLLPLAPEEWHLGCDYHSVDATYRWT